MELLVTLRFEPNHERMTKGYVPWQGCVLNSEKPWEENVLYSTWERRRRVAHNKCWDFIQMEVEE